MKKICPFLGLILLVLNLFSQTQQYSKFEIEFASTLKYNNPVYDVADFTVKFSAPSGKEHVVRGFWDGGNTWKVRFMPLETGTWKWISSCSEKKDSGLNLKKGTFTVVKNKSSELIFRNGPVIHTPGSYHLSYFNGQPFLWLACTAWNGALRSTPDEWEYYLEHRKRNQYSVIQVVTTEWRGCDKNKEGLTAIEGTGYIRINPEFFKRIDKRIDEANAKGFVVSPVILWALPFGEGRHLSPGYTLPLDEAVLLAKYIVARYQGNHVVWTLGGDGKYHDEQELKWKEIGRMVFNGIDHAPVTLHPYGVSWIGHLFASEEWYDLMGYQSSHSNGEYTVNWINRGPVAEMWSKLKPMPYINMEPNYEEIGFNITARDVRNASYWSILATPVAGVTYGANGIWPWLADGEKILHHNDTGGVTGWKKSLDFQGSIQIGYLAGFFKNLEWWNLLPANDLLLNQPGKQKYNQWVSVAKTPDWKTIVAYIPEKSEIELVNPLGVEYSGKWFNPVTNSYSAAIVKQENNRITITPDSENDMLIVLTGK